MFGLEEDGASGICFLISSAASSRFLSLHILKSLRAACHRRAPSVSSLVLESRISPSAGCLLSKHDPVSDKSCTTPRCVFCQVLSDLQLLCESHTHTHSPSSFYYREKVVHKGHFHHLHSSSLFKNLMGISHWIFDYGRK